MPAPIYNTAGIYEIEVDDSYYVPNFVDTRAGQVGPTSRGPIDVAVITTSWEEWQDIFGIVDEKYPSSISARDYYKSGGARLVQVRSAHSDAAPATVTIPLVNSTNLEIPSLDEGDFYNNCKAVVTHSQPISKTVNQTLTVLNQGTPQTFTVPAGGGKPVVPKTLVFKVGSTVIASDNGAGVITFTDSTYANYSGTINYQTGVATITISSTTGSSSVALISSVSAYQYFNIQILYVIKNAAGVALNSPGKIVEIRAGLTLDNFIDQMKSSNYLYVDPDGSAPAAFPVPGTYNFTGGDSGLNNLVDTDIVGNTIGSTPTGLQIFSNPNNIDINTLTVPGYSSHVLVRNAMLDLVNVKRTDVFPLWDTNVDDTKESAVALANSQNQYSSYGVLDSNKGAMYFPWGTTLDSVTGDTMLTPPTVPALCAMAQVRYWEAPAGYACKLPSSFKPLVELDDGGREYLTDNRINPIAPYEGMGVFVMGNQTATLTNSSLDRIPNRIVLNRLEKAMKKAMFVYLFKVNNKSLWQKMTLNIQPKLTELVNQGVLREAYFVCNEQTNTLELQQNNTVACTFELKLNSFAERIIMTFHMNRLDAKISVSYTTSSGVQLQ